VAHTPSCKSRTTHRTAPADPEIRSPQLDAGGGAVLFFEDGRATTLELYANGAAFPEEIKQWTLLG
jgi:hypothetical protein